MKMDRVWALTLFLASLCIGHGSKGWLDASASLVLTIHGTYLWHRNEDWI
jgi:hypothetical protein